MKRFVLLAILAFGAVPLMGCQSLIGAAAGTAANAALAQVAPIPAEDLDSIVQAQNAVQATLDTAMAIVDNFLIATGAPYPGFNRTGPGAKPFQEVTYYVPATGGIALRPVLEKFEDIQWQMTAVKHHTNGSRSFTFRRMIVPEMESQRFSLSDLMANPSLGARNR